MRLLQRVYDIYTKQNNLRSTHVLYNWNTRYIMSQLIIVDGLMYMYL